MLAGFRRRVSAMLSGGFEAAQGSRRLRHFVPARSHVNTLINHAGPTITARARWLVRNNGYASNALESWAANTIGTGISPSPRTKDAEAKARMQALFLAWTDDADAEGLTDFAGLQRRVAREVYIAGEVFVRFRARRPEDGLTVPLQLQLLPSEMLPMHKTESLAGERVIRQGVEFDALGRRVAYHFRRRHPGDITELGSSDETVRVPASEILHVMDPVEGGQVRGVSRFAPAVVKLFFLDQYDDAELDRKKVAAMITHFVTSPAPEGPLGEADEETDGGDRFRNLEPGSFVPLDPGEDVRTSDPADSGGTYEPFQYRTLLQVSAALGVPYAYLSNDMLKANYSNSRLALLEFRRRVEAWQHAVMVFQLCRPVWLRWLETAVLAGALDLPEWERRRAEWIGCDWLPPKWEWVDPLKDANAEIAQIEAGLKSRGQAITERGLDPEAVDQAIAQDKARERRLGLSFKGSAGSRDSGLEDDDADGVPGGRRQGTEDDP